MKSGIAPQLLVSQVKATAPWLWTLADASEPARVLDAGPQANYLELLLSAHYSTVATFCPTDVDARIRHHAWQAMSTPEELRKACAIVDRVASWDARLVSARVDVGGPQHGPLSGHDGEWLAVRAGALGRAASIDTEIAEQITAQIDAELDREEAILREASRDTPKRLLMVCTIVAHNLGDLSRVAADWTTKNNPMLQGLRERYVRLAHPDAAVKRGPFIAAGILNKAIMAHENHRFLPLRKPRALRVDRSLLLPIGPWFDAWAETIAKSEHLEHRDRAEVLEAMLEVHGRDPAQEGCLRAISALHRNLKGGIEILVPDLPARMRKDAMRGKVRDVLDITESHFSARIERRFKTERDALPSGLLP